MAATLKQQAKKVTKSETTLTEHDVKCVSVYSVFKYATNNNCRIRQGMFDSDTGLELLNLKFKDYDLVDKNAFYDLDDVIIHSETYKNFKNVSLKLLINSEVYSFNHNLKLNDGSLTLKMLLELTVHFIGFAADNVSTSEKYDAIFADQHPFLMTFTKLQTRVSEDKVTVHATLKSNALEPLKEKWAALEEQAKANAVFNHEYKKDSYSESVHKSHMLMA
ncbi:hypothetical protein CKO50_20340 [Pseudoalteromonas sp. HM-SA03]|uniref:hypothetical protein n=1 Tax=Pseudoalteromonas sp. HM-SA03 TaxID=2029678 RepID=UPI000BAE5195|nr:hypothetical protein [Pseudoalteromonas sp. HM-SA03]PAX99563.1 hypothetical protein CKO50_20340 [Pseudoalteromonas sp. HM-SA03]